MESFIPKKHVGVILEPSKASFDAGASTFGCAFLDNEDPDNTYIYYSGTKKTKWTQTAIGMAISNDGEQFRKLTKLNPLISGENNQFKLKELVTPAVVRISNYYYMFFAGSTLTSKYIPSLRRIWVAYADDPCGPWKVLGAIAKPETYWEGWSIDLGPSVVKLGEKEIMIYYSNVNNKIPLNIFFGPRYLFRSIGVLKVKIKSPTSIVALKHEGNLLKYLNGPIGDPSESLFCPGYLYLSNRHFLLPSMSTYSVCPLSSIYPVAFPYRQYIGLVSDDNLYFKHAKTISVLIDGPSEKKDIMPNVKSEIALDTPSPIVRKDKIYLYYSIMDRNDGIWKTALSIINKQLFEKLGEITYSHGG